MKSSNDDNYIIYVIGILMEENRFKAQQETEERRIALGLFLLK